MSVAVAARPISDDAPANGAALRWLGQAGFLVRSRGLSLVIDAYLSDVLAVKYRDRGEVLSHRRLMPPPVPADRLRVDWALCTHRHGDHLDAPTLQTILSNNPACRVVLPAAERDFAVGLGLSADRLVPIDAGEQIDLSPIARLTAIAAAHEELTRDVRGQHCYLGYALAVADVTVYHSGDCCPYRGLAERLAGMRIAVALLPVNGRDEVRRSRNILGNFTFNEAVDLCRRAGIGTLTPHHFGMFAFNTVDPAELSRAAASVRDVRICIPCVERELVLTRSH